MVRLRTRTHSLRTGRHPTKRMNVLPPPLSVLPEIPEKVASIRPSDTKISELYTLTLRTFELTYSVTWGLTVLP